MEAEKGESMRYHTILSQITRRPLGLHTLLRVAVSVLLLGQFAPVLADGLPRYAYVAMNSDGVEMFDASTGVLTPLEPPVIRLGYPISIAVDPSGRFVYVAKQYDETVSMYEIASTGVLTPLGKVDTGRDPTLVAVDSSGHFVYAVNYGPPGASTTGSVSVYEMDTTTGQLTALGSPMPTMGRGRSIAIIGSKSPSANARNDFNGDGKSDILWRNTDTGDVAIWFMDDANVSSSIGVAKVPLEWNTVPGPTLNPVDCPSE